MLIMAPEKAKPAISLFVISHVIISTQTRFSFVINTFMWELIEMAIDDDSTQEKLLHILTWNVNKLRVFFQSTYFCGNDENCQSWSLNTSIKTNSIDDVILR